VSESADIKNRRVLVIDDNDAIHHDFRKVLGANAEDDAQAALATLESSVFGEARSAVSRPHFEIDSAHQGQEGVEMARTAHDDGRPYAVAFVDMRMPPGWDGLQTIEHLWAMDPNLQVVICSAHSDYDWSEVVTRLGHTDKLLVLRKPAEPIEILQCVTALARKWHNERALREQLECLEQVVTARTRGLEVAARQLRHVATHDALTGLPNRTLLDDRLRQAVAHADRDGLLFAILVCDLDGFKRVNDSLGQRAGDELLQEAARRLTALSRPCDTVARLGGDKFVLLINSVAAREDVDQVARRVLEALQQPVPIAGIDVHSSSSVGISFYRTDGGSIEAVMAQAEAAMTVAKQRGRGQFECFVPGMNTATEYKAQLESDLHNALALNQFELHYQPKVDTATGAVRSAEALIRWRHPERGLIAPAEFIPLAEECGLIGAIGEWVLREACRQARAWQVDGLASLRVAVNVAASQVRQGALVDVVRRALDDAGLEPLFLEIELTESAMMSDPEEAVAVLEQLSAMGVLVSVDDFGTGYSSMTYLRRFPINKLKIDRVFISEITTRPEDASIVRAIISLAHNLRLKVVAEGVETKAQLDFLTAVGCDEYQGYHFSRPLPVPGFESLIRRSLSKGASFGDEDSLRTHSKLEAFGRR